MHDTDTDEGCSYSGQCKKNLRITVCANQGGRKYMEDRVHIEQVRSSDGTLNYTYVAVYDGHGGADASEFVRKNLLKNIEKQDGFNRSDEEMLEAIRKGFIETHYAMLEVVDCWPLTASGYQSTAGTTASVAFIMQGKIFIGHVGDSAIIVGKNFVDDRTSAICLTVDHKPDNLTEEERINKAGGTIMRKAGVMRVVWTRPLKNHVGPARRSTPTESVAFLSVARSLGDLWSYNKTTKQFIVSPEPDVSIYVLDSTDVCLVLGSDGLTNVLRPKQIVDIGFANILYFNHCFVNHSRVLLRKALKSWGSMRADNITVVTVMLDSANCDPVIDSLYETSANDSGCSLNLEQLFTEHQTDMVRITDKCCQEFSTVPINIVYSGALDQQFCSGSSF
uniref:PPM-type phosphatase domain-containing protein n=1 Tax=Syphacia muris TaxID=451379 RepID=A0A158R3V0_9BILA